MSMRVLMFGWEFPPFASGGLGTACFGLTKGLNNHGASVTFVMPKVPNKPDSTHVDLISAHDVTDNVYSEAQVNEFVEVDSILTPYMTVEEYRKKLDVVEKPGNALSKEFPSSEKSEKGKVYGKNLFHEVWRYRQTGGLVAKKKDFDVIHCHDWMTYGAGIEAKKQSGKPLVVHIHATEFDRTGSRPNQYVYDLEKEGFTHADKILAVSNFTKNRLVEHYDVHPDKVEVVHNAVEWDDKEFNTKSEIPLDKKVVLFLGRITIQKGPDWFLYAAKKVIEHNPDVMFVVAGSGDMENFMISKAAELGMSDKMLFAGFLRGPDIDKAYRMANLYVMPSISEPFGITPLESMRNGTPVLISKQSGVSEVIRHCLKADFWDIDDMANKMVAALNHDVLHTQLKDEGLKEVRTFSWNDPAKKCMDAYNSVILSNLNNKFGGEK